jgi:hypothetical protein
MIMDPKGHRMAHPVYSMRDIETIEATHHKPENLVDSAAKLSIRGVRFLFDVLT